MSELEAWQKKGMESTVGRLWDYLIELERKDILCREVIRKRIEQDVGQYRRREKELLVDDDHFGSEPAIRMPAMPRITAGKYPGGIDKLARMDMMADEFKDITIGEITSGRPEMFDAFISYSIEDIHFVKEMIRMLEQVHGLKLCINARDLTVGVSNYTVTAKIIAERCRKVLIVMSNSFLYEPECDFQVKFAQALSPGSRSKKMIPILIEPCEMPLILRHVTIVDHTKCDLIEWFWVRLAKSLLAMSYSEPEFEFQVDDDQDEMEGLKFDFSREIDMSTIIGSDKEEEDSHTQPAYSASSTRQITARLASRGSSGGSSPQPVRREAELQPLPAYPGGRGRTQLVASPPSRVDTVAGWEDLGGRSPSPPLPSLPDIPMPPRTQPQQLKKKKGFFQKLGEKKK